MRHFRLLRASICLSLCVALATPAPALADWGDRSGDLPGLVSTKVILVELAALGGALAWLIVARKSKAKKLAASPLQAPPRLEFGETDTSRVLSIVNQGAEPLSLSEVGFSGGGFTSPVVTPVVIMPGTAVSLAVDREVASSRKKAKLLLTALLPTGQSFDRSVEIRVTD